MAIVSLCGSGKFKQLVHGIARRLEDKGLIVLSPPLHNIGQLMHGIEPEGVFLAWKGATFAHMNRIATSDICLMINPNGYLGVSSTMELGYAAAMHKLIIALRHDEELARESLFDIVLDTEDENGVADRVFRIASTI